MLDAIREQLPADAAKGGAFRGGDVCQAAYVGRSRSNGPFLAYALHGEGLLAPAGENDPNVVRSEREALFKRLSL